MSHRPLFLIALTVLITVFSSVRVWAQNNGNSPTGNYVSGANTGPTTNTNNNALHKTAPLSVNANNAPQNNNQRLQPNIIISVPAGVQNESRTSGDATAGSANSRARRAEPPANPGYDTTSSLGGPSNNQGNITYSSSGIIKTQNQPK